MADKKAIKSPLTGTLHVPPQNIEAEKALLGSIMVKPDALYDVIDFITPECFYVDKHGRIFGVMVELFSKSQPIDLLSLSSRMKEKNMLEKVGGASYLTELVNTVPSASNIKHYAQIVHGKYMCRRLIEAAHTINTLGFDEAEDIDVLLDKAEKTLYDVTEKSSGASYVELSGELKEAFERLETLSKNDESLRGVPTGFQSLDNKLSGFQKSDLIILAARPSTGKTSLALDMARKTAVNHDNSVCIFSLEMSSQQLVDRMLAAESYVDAWKLRTGRVRAQDDFRNLSHALDRLSRSNIYIDDQPGNTILKMRSVARRIKRERGLDLIVVDYLQLMLPSGNARNSDSMVFQITEISRSLKTLARELEVPVLALSQLSRAVEQRGGKPRLSDLRDSGSIEQDADVVMFIHRDRNDDDAGRSNHSEIIIAKHRNGPIGTIEMNFDDLRTTFTEVSSDFKSFDPEVDGE